MDSFYCWERKSLLFKTEIGWRSVEILIPEAPQASHRFRISIGQFIVDPVVDTLQTASVARRHLWTVTHTDTDRPAQFV